MLKISPLCLINSLESIRLHLCTTERERDVPQHALCERAHARVSSLPFFAIIKAQNANCCCCCCWGREREEEEELCQNHIIEMYYYYHSEEEEENTLSLNTLV